MTSKISLLTDQIAFERRVSVTQLVIMVSLFVFMALSRGTFSPLSPVMAAQQEERKRRESIDLSSTGVSKMDPSTLTKESATTKEQKQQSKQSQGTISANLTDASTKENEDRQNQKPVAIATGVPKLKDAPLKKPTNPRRHSDSPYHLMARKADGHSSSSNSTKGNEYHKPCNSSNSASTKSTRKQMSFESLGIKVQDDNEFLKQLDDALLKQQQQERLPATVIEKTPQNKGSEPADGKESNQRQKTPLLDNDISSTDLEYKMINSSPNSLE
ncbi:hypothetical protein BDF20DRAFT_524389 [Mycotypha africana]|uniref:uncharacterized protein n=1 Tax=Mycotypha africana TaxID=64632 RepID=UPI002301B1EA|nr:uncharacterized protein BDF20DRAFT_524389 [Mycotypha africana]KAI8979672.1 hypothetical protein BDF20DRAFT_524389 [Mycotypha africana]